MTMRLHKFMHWLAPVVLCCVALPGVEAQEPALPPPPEQGVFFATAPVEAPCWSCQGSDGPFVCGQWSFGLSTGSYFRTNIGPLGPTYDYVPINARLGLIWNTPGGDSIFRGCFESIIEATALTFYEGPADIFAGPSALLRYNFVQPDCRLVPYIQLGAGFGYCDGHEDHDQGTLGSPIEFLLQAQVGCRLLLNENWSLDIEGGLQHISNAGTAARNGGLNTLGGVIGLTYFFPSCCR